MRSRLPISPSTAVALLLAAATAVVVALAFTGSAPSASAHDPTDRGPASPSTASDVDESPGDDGGSDDGASDDLEGSADFETASLRGGDGASGEGPVAGASAATRPIVTGECPVMTDSIRRLYRAYLEREPTARELERDIGQYRTGRANLEALSAALADGGLFRTLYGPLADEAFVRQIYRNTVDREPDDDDLAHWLTILDAGYPRGAVVLAMTESAEFVRRTGTSRPLSGYLNWYPDGVHWYCGVGPQDDLPIRPLVEGDLYADFMFTNVGSPGTDTGLTTVLDGLPRVTMNEGSLPAGFTDFRWDGRFGGADNYGEAIDVMGGDDTGWVVVFYPRSIGDQRLGWQLAR